MLILQERCEGFTGLEAAIVLIAFVVVASVFAFSVIGAGYFATQQTQSTAYTALQQTGSTLEVLGYVHGIKRADDEIGAIQFNVGLAPGGKYIDFSKMVLTWTTRDEIRIYDANEPLYNTTIDEGKWGIVGIKPTDAAGDTVLESGETYTIYVNLAPGEELGPGEEFSLELTSTSAMSLIISRSAPWQIDNINNLY
ncbi:archaellin/type IV pilin N-terminal domain-containing protein [Methanolacinia paynteri]|uniref:archaellin/type IV pilin N-terminal domain-containing protein n=1 Tax=Methanolacinia paynteri TaxID=230356 RepID=UPI00064EB3C7|nr:flagellin [Methanolacinia paynteri]